MKIFVPFLICIILFQTEVPNSFLMEPLMKQPEHKNLNDTKIKIIIGTKTFSATLTDNNTAMAFKSKLPISLKMTELNGNEKYGELSDRLPTNPSNPGKIQVGDLMLFGDQTLVLFYKSFTTSYNYTRIGRIDDIKDLTEVLGSGNIYARFELGPNK